MGIKSIKKFLVLAMVLLAGSIGVYAWHLYMIVTIDHHFILKQQYYKIKEKNKKYDIPSLEFSRVANDKIPEKYKRQIEIVKRGDNYIWMNNGEQKLTRTIKTEERINRGKPTGDFHESYVYSNFNNTLVITVRMNDYDFSGCKRKYDFWSGNVEIVQTMENGDLLNSRSYFDVYETPFQYFFCGFFPAPRP